MRPIGMKGKLRTHVFVAGNCANEKSAISKSIVSVYCDEDDDSPDTRTGVIISSRLVLTAIARPTPDYWCQVVIEDDIAPTNRYIRESWETLHFQDEINDYPWLSPQLQILVLYSPMVLTIGKFNDHEVARPMLYGKTPNYSDGDVCTAHTIIEKEGRELDEKVSYQVTMMSEDDCKKIYEELDDDVICIKMNDCDTHCKDLLPGSAIVCNDDLVAIVSEHHNCDNNKPRALYSAEEACVWLKKMFAWVFGFVCGVRMRDVCAYELKYVQEESNNCDLKAASAHVCSTVLGKMFDAFDELIYFVTYILLIYRPEFANGQCSSDTSNLATSFGLLNCKHLEQESERVGIIIKETYILTASILPPTIWCEIIYKDFETKSERSDSFIMTNLGDDVNLHPAVAPQLQMLELVKPIDFRSKYAAKVGLISKQPSDKKYEGSEVHTYDVESKKIVEYKVNVVDREECEKSYENLHINVLCIKMENEGCNHCEILKAGSGVAFNDELIGVVSDDPKCDKDKPRVCASVHGNLKWIRSVAGIGGFWIFSSANCKQILSHWSFLLLHFLIPFITSCL
uniref:Uncharacterized protein n=1 Tax=Glossina pallidipes TaxID=7398 RepID=A0A1A9ZAE5_GLOPL